MKYLVILIIFFFASCAYRPCDKGHKHKVKQESLIKDKKYRLTILTH